MQGSDRVALSGTVCWLHCFRQPDRWLLNFSLSNFIHLHEVPVKAELTAFVSEQGAAQGMYVASQLNAREWLG